MNRLFLLYFPGYFDGDEIIGIYDDVIELKKAYNRVIADKNKEYEIYLNNPNTELSIKEFDTKKQEFVDVDLQRLWEYTDKIHNYQAICAISNNPGEITLSGFTFMKDRTPNDFEVCLIVWHDGQVSAGCWITDSVGKGNFRQGRNGILEAECVLAWLPLEGKLYIEKNIWWDPEYRLIADFLECFRVFAKDGDAFLVFEYTGGEEKMTFHMNAGTGEIPELNKGGYEDLSYIKNVLSEWYEVFKPELLKGITSGRYKELL